MKRTLLFAVLIALPLVTGCKKQLYHLTGVLNVDQLYEVDDADGAYQGSQTFLASEITGELDLAENARITDVNVESIFLKMVPQSGNAATSATGSAYLTVVGGGASPQALFQNVTIPIANTTILLDDLNSLGVGILKTQLERIVRGESTNSIKLDVQVAANRAPLKVDITLQIRGTVDNDACVELPTWFSEGEDCDIAE